MTEAKRLPTGISMDQRKPHVLLAVCWLVLSIWFASFDRLAATDAGPTPFSEEEIEKESKKKKSKKKNGKETSKRKTKTAEETEEKSGESEPSIDELYIRDTLKQYLHPTSLEFLKDGRAKMVFNFDKKEPEHESIFNRRVDSKINSTFRWTVGREERMYYRGFNQKPYSHGGLRVSNAGIALLNCWFTDDVEAEIQFVMDTNFSPRRTVALVFSSGKETVGNNFGSQCVIYRGGKPRKRAGTSRSMTLTAGRKIKLVVKEGTFEAHQDGREQTSLAYSQKKLGSGKIGLLWGGNAAGMIYQLEVTGKIDEKKMAEQLRKATRKKKR